MWSLLICAVKNCSVNMAALGPGAKSGAGENSAVGETINSVLPPLLFASAHPTFQLKTQLGCVRHESRAAHVGLADDRLSYHARERSRHVYVKHRYRQPLNSYRKGSSSRRHLQWRKDRVRSVYSPPSGAASNSDRWVFRLRCCPRYRPGIKILELNTPQ